MNYNLKLLTIHLKCYMFGRSVLFGKSYLVVDIIHASMSSRVRDPT